MSRPRIRFFMEKDGASISFELISANELKHKEDVDDLDVCKRLLQKFGWRTTAISN